MQPTGLVSSMQPYSKPTRWNLEDDLIFLKMEDDLNVLKMEDELNFLQIEDDLLFFIMENNLNILQHLQHLTNTKTKLNYHK